MPAELLNVSHYWAVFMREVSETGDDYIFSSRAYTSIVKGLTRSNNKAEQAKYDLCICVD